MALHEVRQDLKMVKAYVAPSKAASGLDVFKTIDSVEKLYEFDDLLSEKAFVKEVTRRLIFDLADNLSKTVTNVMNRIATKEVWRKFSHKGQRGADSFVELRRINLLVTSFVATHRPASDPKKTSSKLDRALQVYFSEVKRRRSSNVVPQGK